MAVLLARRATLPVLALALGAAVALPTLLAAQDAPADAVLHGQVVKEGAPVPGVEVTLHQVSSQGSGVVGVRETTSGGAFEFSLPAAADTAGFNVFFVTVDHLSVRHFGAPVHRGEVPAGYTVELYDTTSVLPGALRVARRDVILLPATDGSWAANELIRIVNTGTKTLVPAGASPTWEFPVPSGATDVEVTEGDVASADVRLMGDRVLFVGSLSPGSRELILRYRFPPDADEVVLRATEATDTFGIYLPEAAAGAEVTGLTTTRVVPVEQERFVQYTGTDLAAGHEVRVTWTAAGPPVDPVVAGVAVAVVILAVGTWMGLRSRDHAGSPTGVAPRVAARPGV